ncbi:preprotein translocase subunit SecE [Companilactobacillus allii]|uniref:Protein translocase subunit SecE n=1 Tax=Companilactobacillus allii TaxID=1847728 RepID=A0A1P8PZP1_9LACO|nr:preprotein translocase subunit SecE [Companilactobacillus allii]APX71098.1 preprotein translocase subunit SecE [Companilactobacillus allii]USQ68176.1 preprotein translocase subunit SecE [Companilactobacillus allii]
MKLFKFFGSVKKEMKVVVWPTAKENRRDTWTVVATSLMYAIFFAAVDWALVALLQQFIMGSK